MFFIFFLTASRLISIYSPAALMTWGIIFICAAVALDILNKNKNLFQEQFALAVSTTGHVLLLMAVDRYGGVLWIFLTALFLCVLLYGLYKNSIHRFLSCLLAIGTAVVYILNSGNHHWLHVLLLIEVAAVGFILAKKWNSNPWRPMGYALTIAVPLMFLLLLLPRREIHTPWWPSNIILIFSLLALYWWVSKTAKTKTSRTEPLILAVLVTLLLGAVSSPGILASAGLLVLGYHLRDNPLTGLGLTFLPAYIVLFYYNLNMSLDVKSWMLIGSGAILLGLRWYLTHRPWTTEETQ